jgi:DNA-binding transcriptional LysR family regulator
MGEGSLLRPAPPWLLRCKKARARHGAAKGLEAVRLLANNGKSKVSMGLIDAMNLAGFDLNLLLVFHAMMTERHATRAGHRIGLSQPAVSAALNRLRSIFDDELFIRQSGEMAPTPRALSLAEPIREALHRVEAALAGSPHFDPATMRRDFTVRGVDYVSYLLIAPMMARLSKSAPDIVVRCVDAQMGSVPELLQAGRIDFAIEVMHQLEDPVRSQFLIRERYVVIVAAQHPAIEAGGQLFSQAAFDLDLYCKLPHVLHSFVGGTTGNVDSALAAINRRRLVGLSMPHFFSIAETVARSELIATFPERMALRLAPILGLRVYEVPVALAPISLALIWHRRNDGDAGCMWFRQQVIQFAKSLG